MSVIDGTKLVNDNMLNAAAYASTAAMKAPKMAKTELVVKVLTGEDLMPLQEILEIVGEASAFINGDAIVTKKAYKTGTPVVEVLLGAKTTRSDLAWDCGACGFNTCAEFNSYSKKNFSQGAYYAGPSCNWKALDFGIAQSWAAAAAWQMNVENRTQTSYGFAALALGLMEDCNVCVGVSMGPVRDQTWYSRPDCKHSFDMEEHEEFMLNCLPQIQTGFCGSGKPMVKHGPDWASNPKFLKMVESPEYSEKMGDIMQRVGAVIEREKNK